MSDTAVWYDGREWTTVSPEQVTPSTFALLLCALVALALVMWWRR